MTAEIACAQEKLHRSIGIKFGHLKRSIGRKHWRARLEIIEPLNLDIEFLRWKAFARFID